VSTTSAARVPVAAAAVARGGGAHT